MEGAVLSGKLAAQAIVEVIIFCCSVTRSVALITFSCIEAFMHDLMHDVRVLIYCVSLLLQKEGEKQVK